MAALVQVGGSRFAIVLPVLEQPIGDEQDAVADRDRRFPLPAADDQPAVLVRQRGAALCWPCSLSGVGSWHSCARIARRSPQKDYTASTASLMPIRRVVDPSRPN